MTDTVPAERQRPVPDPERGESEWPLRPWLLAALLGLAGLLIHFLTHGTDEVAWRVAAAAFVFFGAIAAAFTLEQRRWKAPSLFALAIALVMAGLAWRAVQYGERLPDEQYGFAAGVVASALALPLFQSGFLKARLATRYEDIHYHVWTDGISAAGALAFTGLSWLVLVLLSELFHLLKIDLLRDLMNEEWFGWTFSGLAFGAALGTLRNQLRVLGTLQTVLLLVLSLLAVPLAFALVVFLLATAVSGPQVLWEATRSATPLLLTCAAGAWALASVIVRYEDAAMSRSRVMRAAAIVLAVVILPLAVFAAVSMGLRLGQYGLAPERLWGVVAIVVACVYGVGFWAALVRGRKGGWATRMREANFHLGLFVCGLALLLALPVLDFGAISTRNQVARLENGSVSPDKFDFAALRWDFGEPGRRALDRLAKAGGTIGEHAAIAQKQTQRPYGWAREIRDESDFALTVQPNDPQLRKLVLDYLRANPWACRERCVAVQTAAATGGQRQVAIVQDRGFEEVLLPDQGGDSVGNERFGSGAESGALKPGSKVDVRTIEKRYIFIDGKPLDRPLGDGPLPPRIGIEPAPPAISE